MQAAQFVMAYGVEQDRLRAILPEGLPPCGRCFGSTGRSGVKKAFSNSGQPWKETGKGGRLSIGSFSNVPFEVIEKTTAFQGELLEIAFTRRKRPRSGRNTATAAFAGSSRRELMERVWERPFRRRRSIGIRKSRLPWKTSQQSPADGCWEAIGSHLSDKKEKLPLSHKNESGSFCPFIKSFPCRSSAPEDRWLHKTSGRRNCRPRRSR